jgi:hypothetical protein
VSELRGVAEEEEEEEEEVVVERAGVEGGVEGLRRAGCAGGASGAMCAGGERGSEWQAGQWDRWDTARTVAGPWQRRDGWGAGVRWEDQRGAS